MRVIEIHSDGASASRGGFPGGWAWVLTIDGNIVASNSGGEPATTNNVMEMTGALDGLENYLNLFRQPGDRVTLISDSRYTLGMASGKFTPTANVELVQKLRRVAALSRAATRHVHGHQLKKGQDWRQLHPDILLNFRCDQLATAAKQKIIARVQEEALRKAPAPEDDIPY